MKRLFVASMVALFASGAVAENVKVGALYPLSGNAASAGGQTKAAIELAVEIINGQHPDVQGMPGTGLPGLKGGKIEVIFADHQGNPSTGQSQALRLIQQDKVTAVIGAYQSSVTFASTQVAERYGIPFVVGDSVAANITGRGFKYVFRVTPVATDFAYNYMDFLKDVAATGQPTKNLAVVYENTDYGTSIIDTMRKVIKERGFELMADIPYNANTTDVSSQVLQLKDKKPDAVIFVSYTADTILYMRTLKQLDYRPPVVIGDDSGFSDPAFIKNVGTIAQSAINRAGSAKSDAIRDALKATDLKPDQLMMGYKGVKFDETGQNVLAATYLIQLQGDQYVAVWPAQSATAKLQIPYKGW